MILNARVQRGPLGRALREVRDARNTEHHDCARRRDGELAVSSGSTRLYAPSPLLAAAPLRLIKESVAIQRRQAATRPLPRRYPLTTKSM